MSNVDEKLLKRLLEEREKLLEEHPELIPLQNEVNRALDKVGDNPLLRSQKCFEMLSDMINQELLPEAQNLKELIEKVLTLEDEDPSKKRRTG